MANPWDNDPIKTPAQAAPWEADPIKRPAAPRSPAGHPSFEEGQALLNAEEQQQRMKGASGTIGATLTGLADGVPIAGPALLGAGQRGAAIASTVMNGGTYDENLKQAQDITQQAQGSHPWVTTGANVAGAVGGTIPMMAAAPAAFGIGTASTPVAMAAGGATGLAIGSTDAGVRSDWDPQKMVIGGGLGLGMGVVGPLAGNIVGRAYRSIGSGRATTEAARQAGTNPEAVDVVARSLAADNAAGATNANISAAGPNAMLADAGPSTLSVLDTAIQRGGPQAGRAAQRINARAEAATQEINSALDAGLGPSEGIVAPLNALRRSTQPARSAAYDAAYERPIDYADPRGRLLEKIVKERVPASAINKANELMRVNGERSQQILAKIGDDGSVTLETLPDVRQIDYITRGLKAVADEADGMGKLGGTTDLGRAYGNLSTEIRNITKALVPEYKTALDTAATPIAAKQAREFGQKMLSPAIARDEAEEFITSLSAAELKSLKGGIRGDVAEKLSNVKRTLSDPNVDARQGIAALRELSSDAVREKMTMVMGKNEADAMFRAIDQAGRSFDLRAGVTANSKTYARQAAERAVDAATQPGVIETAASGRPIKAAQGWIQSLLGTGPEAQLARQDAAWGEIANILTQPANQGGGTFLQALQGAAGRLPIIDQQAARIANSVAAGTAISSGPTRRLAGIK
ncbi:hypothetical protein [Rhizobium rhizogenes]|uniref:hypothetical protein n=1 Tax=Rhizobium rhizogenes TaxID=359 RepID=UPI0022C7A556|nr:hypothetical protein [Rhizobium rhizogenes]MCZ7463547.1 hypothetical protein [Rhizobium rhizogenes]